MKKLFSGIALLLSATGFAQNVGIGETTPTESKLQVKSTDSAVLLIQNTASALNTKTALFYKSDNNYSGGIATIQTAPSFYRMGLFTFGGAAASGLKERMSILDDGNVGIGTTTPNYLLDINGRARLRHNGNTSGIWYNKADNTDGSFVGMNNDTTFGFYGSNGWSSVFDIKNSRLGIGTLTPTAPLSFPGTLGNKIALWGNAAGGHYGLGIQGNLLQIYSQGTADDIVLGYGNSTVFTENMRVKGNGNVGIGTNNPGAKLDVNGTVKIADGTQGVNKVLTSDAAGNATWRQTADPVGSVGFGTWGDCSTNGISEYNPVADPDAGYQDLMGSNVAISGNWAMVTSRWDDITANDQGSVSFYMFNGTNWVFTQKIWETVAGNDDDFGYGLALSGNYGFVGIPGDEVGANANQGSVNVYFYNGSSWVFTQKLTDAAGAAGDFFGNSVAISGNFAIVGAPGDDNGATDNGSACFYQLLAGSWIFKQKNSDPGLAANDQLGTSVSISGNYAFAGVPFDDAGAITDQGSVVTFFNNGSNWVFTQKITDASGQGSDNFGQSVSLSGNYAVIGSPKDGSGGNADQGSASFYNYNGSTWSFMQKKLETTSSGDHFGTSVYISGDYAIVGAPDDNGLANDEGSATIYLRIGFGWQKQQNFFAPGGGDQNDVLGQRAAIDGSNKRFLVGVPGYASFSGKALFGKVN